MITIEGLQKFNDLVNRYDFPVTAKDVEMTLRIAKAIENTRSEESPIPGDVIICKGPYKYYGSGHMENHSSICVQPHTPFAEESDGVPIFTTSGGYWFSCEDVTMFKKEPTARMKTFWTWGSEGATAGGGVYFEAQVNVWSIFKESIY